MITINRNNYLSINWLGDIYGWARFMLFIEDKKPVPQFGTVHGEDDAGTHYNE